MFDALRTIAKAIRAMVVTVGAVPLFVSAVAICILADRDWNRPSDA